MNETPQPPPLQTTSSAETAQDTSVVGYCRACGRALNATTVRYSHGAIYCQEHVPAEAGASTASPYSGTAYTAPPPVPNPHVSPALAFILGLIPGVGAIYNGQYVKGLVHVLIAGFLFALVDNPPGGFEVLSVLLLAGFFWYMAFEAYHTARQRRLGLKTDEFSSVMPLNRTGFPAAPVILIALGVVFLLSNLGILHLREILRYWPVLLIALGVYMLYARAAGTKETGR